MGHIHIGYKNHNLITNNYIVKALDLFLGIPLLLMEPENERKKMYGKAGSYREQPWGVEARSSSNYLISSPELMKWAFNQILEAVKFVNNDKLRNILDYDKSIETIINTKDKVKAKELIAKFDIKLLEPVIKELKLA